ncbi:MAG: PepSY domain-containing protein [Christensenellales bacterium]|jgi:uncharacterized membrane protein YkoI
MSKRKIFATVLILILAMCVALVAGCSNQAASADENIGEVADTGTIILRVNPEIAVHYNKEGLATKLDGLNDDGTKIVGEYADYIGKNARDVVKDLVGKINAAGYFVSDMDGGYRNITIQIEPGSVLPQDDFIEVLAGDVQTTVKGLNLNSNILDIGPEDYKNDSAKRRTIAVDNKGGNDEYITMDRAIEIALAHANVKSEDAVFDDKEFDKDDGRAIYELEFKAKGIEYEYDIDAKIGRIISYEWDDKNASKSATPAPTSGKTAAPKRTKDDSDYSDYDDSGYSDHGDSGHSDYDDSGHSDYDDSGYSDYD